MLLYFAASFFLTSWSRANQAKPYSLIAVFAFCCSFEWPRGSITFYRIYLKNLRYLNCTFKSSIESVEITSIRLPLNCCSTIQRISQKKTKKNNHLHSNPASSFLSGHKGHFILSQAVSARVSGTVQWVIRLLKIAIWVLKLIGKIWKDLRSIRRIQYLQCSPSVLWGDSALTRLMIQIGTVVFQKDSIFRGDDWEVRRQG